MNDNLDIHISKWISWIQNEKRLSSYTVISYNSDLKSFFYFLKSHLNKEIKYELLSKIDEDDLLKILQYIEIAEAKLFRQSSLDRVNQIIKNEYLNRGRYGILIRSEVINLERNRVKLIFCRARIRIF